MSKKIFLSFVLFLTFSFNFCNAQYRRTPQERAQNLQTRLKLTDQQTQKVTDIFQWADSTISTKMNDSSMSRMDRRELFRSTMDSANVQIEKILTDDQKAEYQKLLQQRMNRFHMRNNRNG